MAVKKEDEKDMLWRIVLKFFEQVQKQGFAITIMLVATYFLFTQNVQNQGRIDACMQMRIQDGKEDRKEFLQVMSEVREALRENTRAIRKKAED